MFNHIKLSEETVNSVIPLLEQTTNEYAVTIFSFHVAAENNYLEIFKKEQGVQSSQKLLEEAKDPYYKTELSQTFVTGTLDIEFIRNEGKNSIKYYAKQQSKVRNFLPFGTDFFFEEGSKYAVSIYTRKGDSLTQVNIFTVKTVSDYLQDMVYQRKRAQL